MRKITIYWMLIWMVLLFTNTACNKKDYFSQETPSESPPMENEKKDLKEFKYAKAKIPLPPVNFEKGEYFTLLMYGDELRAMVQSEIYEEEKDSIRKETHLKLYRFNGEEWSDAGMEKTVEDIGLSGFCYDTSDILYAHSGVFIESGNKTIEERLSEANNRDASKIWMFFSNNDMETITLEDKDVLSKAIISENPTAPEKYKKTLEVPTVTSFKFMENNRASLLYRIPTMDALTEDSTGLQLIVYDLNTGKALNSLDFPGTDFSHYTISGNTMICYSMYDIGKTTTPSLLVTDIRTGQYIGRCYFGNKWEELGSDLSLNPGGFKIASGMEDDVYVCALNGIYGGSIDKYSGNIDKSELKLIVPPSELELQNDSRIHQFVVGAYHDFYVLSGIVDASDNIELFHLEIEE